MKRRPPDTAAAQLRRLLLTLAKLADDQPHQYSELAEMVGVDEKTVSSDLRTLVTRSGYEPGGYAEAIILMLERETVRMQTTVLHRPMALSSGELRALEVGLAALQMELPPHEAAVAENARGRVSALATARERQQGAANGAADTHAVGSTTSETERHVYSVLREATATNKKAMLHYRTGGVANANARTVHPYGLVNSQGRWYLLAFCDKAEYIRIFRLDRITNAVVLADNAVIPKDLDLKSVLMGNRAIVSQLADSLRVRYSKEIARWIKEDYEAKEQRDGSVVVEHPLLDDTWAVRHVLGYGPEAVVLEPARIRDQVAARLKAMLATSP